MPRAATGEPDVLAAELRDLVCDVLGECAPPLAVLLTGDVESGLLCALAAERHRVRSVAVVLDEPSLQRARLVAERLGVPQEEVVLPSSVADLLGDLAAASDAPPSDPLVLQRFLAAQVAAADAGTLISPCGADELFGRLRGDGRAPAQPLRLPLPERMPYFDERVAELALGLPQSFKTRGLSTKLLLRRAALPLLPGAVVHSPERSRRVQRRFAREVGRHAALWH